MPLVSIITPCYNSEKTIAQTIESVQNQTFKDWEMIIVDDCSRDSSRQIIKSYANNDDRIKLLCNEKPSGSPTQPRNTAIKNASGRYITFLDSDDIWHNSKIENQLATAHKYKTPFVFSNYEKMSADGTLTNRIVTAPAKVSIKDMYYGNPIGCLTVMIDTSIVKNLEFENTGHEDCVAWIIILQQGYTAYNTNSTEAAYRESENSVSSNKFKILNWQWNIYRKTLNFGILKSVYYYLHYAVRGFLKSRI